ncbi:hypothetical protein CDAR_448111 [Caerostris darwini]|uniref:Uncharacterized protein n=1 Tax=Caerostris darwini TaxID=1538125 RepID=A0AAV4SAC2_9ARAC|nr:hypothetical protein CDAR_448111 [Caerostris darwini]
MRLTLQITSGRLDNGTNSAITPFSNTCLNILVIESWCLVHTPQDQVVVPWPVDKGQRHDDCLHKLNRDMCSF